MKFKTTIIYFEYFLNFSYHNKPKSLMNLKLVNSISHI